MFRACLILCICAGCVPAAVTVAVVPTSATLAIGQTQQFSATVRNTSNTAVIWEVNGVPGGSAGTGTITNTGLYTSPATVPAHSVVTVKAVSVANSSQAA